MDLTLPKIYQFGKESVQLFPENTDKPCLQLQAFRVLTRGGGATEITTETLGGVPSDKNGPFFWSRKWHNNKYNPNALTFDFPILTMFETIGESKTSPFQSPFGQTYSIELAVFDVYKEDCVDGSKTGCAARTINEIYLDTGTLLNSVLEYFSKIVNVRFADGCTGLYNSDWLEAAKARGIVGNYDIIGYLSATLAPMNKQVRFARVDRFAANNIYGTKCIIEFPVNVCQAIDYNFELSDFGANGFEVGCKNC